jgi:hypothetical protein
MFWYPPRAIPRASVALVILGLVLALLAGLDLAAARGSAGAHSEIVVHGSAS